MKRPLKQYTRECGLRNKTQENIPVYSVTNSHGFVPSTDYFSKEVYSKDLSNYKIVSRGMIAYNPSRVNVGSLAVQNAEDKVIVSPLYVVFSVDESELMPEYVSYFLHSERGIKEIVAHTSGSVRDSLKFSALQDIEINICSLNEQAHIVSLLQKIERIIEKRRSVLVKIDDLVKSQFIEMFGEIGSDKNGWGIHPLAEYCDVNPKKGEDTRIRKGMEVSFVPMQSVSEQGDIDASAVRTYEEVQKGFTYFSEGDVLFAKITPCMENGKGAIARGLKNSVGFGSTEFHVLRPKAGVCNSEWIYAITSFPQFRQDAARKMTGSAGQRRVPASFWASYLVSCPPFELQERFARFVEQTDKSKFRIKQSLEKLETLYKALLQKYFG